MKIILSVLALSIGLFACTPKKATTTRNSNKNKKSNEYGRVGCPPNLACTMEFRYVMVKWLNTDGEPVKLDSISATRVADGYQLARQQPTVNPNPDGGYTIASDANLGEVSRKGTNILLQGYMSGKLIARNKIVLSNDCCHIINTNNVNLLRSDNLN